MNTTRRTFQSKVFPILTALSLSALPVLAETVIVESRTAGGGITANPPYLETAPSWSSSASHAGLGGTTSGVGSRFGFGGTPSVRITPTLVPGSTYSMAISHIAGNASPNVVVNITYSGCSGSASSTTVFNGSVSMAWESIGTITVDAGVTQPSITFTYASGTLAGTGGRWYMDAIQFVNQSDPCTTALPQLATVNGPLAEGQTFVDVPAVSGSATAVTVYADGVQIGEKAGGVAAGVNRVITSPLVKGRNITVTQRNGAGVDSCRPGTGPIVGGGANPPLRVALSIKQNGSLTGPIGANGGTATLPLKFLGATNTVLGGFGNAPAGSKLVTPGTGWQTVTFLRGSDPANPADPTYAWAQSDGSNLLLGNYGILDAIAITCDQTNSGPFAIYLDNLTNGDTLIQDFETAGSGAQAVLFAQPSFSGSTTPFLLSPTPGDYSPNVSMVTNNTADNSTKSLFVNWQFKDAATFDWLRLVAQGSGTPNPIVDLRLPISFRILVLPVGSVVSPTAPAILTQPQGGEVVQSGFVTLRVVATGSGPLLYQWRKDGNPIGGATNSSLRLTNFQASAAGQYTVSISNAVDGVISSEAGLTLRPALFTQVLTPLWKLAPGSRPYLTNDGSQRSLAYYPPSGTLLLLSRFPTNAIYVLDSQTGAELHTMRLTTALDPNLISGGTYALNKLAVNDENIICAANLTEDGTTNAFKIYAWFTDGAAEEPSLLWQGDPGNGQPARWGDSLDARGPSFGGQMLAGSRSGKTVAVLQPLENTATLVNVPDAEDGSFGLCVAFGAGNTFWGKSLGTALREVSFDLGTGLGTPLRAITNYPAMTAFGLDLPNQRLAGLMLETPDTLRLLDMSSLYPAGQLVDTEFFPTDNANANGTGEVRFGGGKVFALDSNNGILALCIGGRLAFSLNGTMLTLTWQGTHTLQATPDLSQPFTSIDGATSGYTVDTTAAGTLFYRLKD